MTSPDRRVFEDRRRAESFGAFAELYDFARPSYPQELIDWLGGAGTGIAADVGCGTGQVARLLAASGWKVVGVDADSRMADVARSHGIDVDVSNFEHWQPTIRFDLITSGQAWHWIDPDVGYRRAGDLLRSGGRLALFWNSYRYDSATQATLETTVNRHAPNLMVDSVQFGTSYPDHAALDAETIRKSARWFDEPEFRTFVHRRTQTIDEWLDEMRTHSPVEMLDEAVRADLFSDLYSMLGERDDGRIHIEYQTRVIAALRR